MKKLFVTLSLCLAPLSVAQAASCPNASIDLKQPMRAIGANLKIVAQRDRHPMDAVINAAKEIQLQSSSIVCAALPSELPEEQRTSQQHLKYKSLILSLATEAVKLEAALLEQDQASIETSINEMLQWRKEGHTLFKPRSR